MKLTEFEIDNLIKDNILLKERVKQLKIDKEKLKEQLTLTDVGQRSELLSDTKCDKFNEEVEQLKNDLESRGIL